MDHVGMATTRAEAAVISSHMDHVGRTAVREEPSLRVVAVVLGARRHEALLGGVDAGAHARTAVPASRSLLLRPHFASEAVVRLDWGGGGRGARRPGGGAALPSHRLVLEGALPPGVAEA